MNKQIEEMEKLCQFFKDGNCTICEELLVDCNSNCPILEFAKRILEADHRKQSEVDDWREIAEGYQRMFEEAYESHQKELIQVKSEVAREIFADIEQAIFAHGTKYAMKRLEELKKRYEVMEDES